MAKYALVIAEWPVELHQKQFHLFPGGLNQEWIALLERVRKASESGSLPSAKVEAIGQGVWVVPLDGGLRALSELCQAVDGNEGLSWGYRVLFFDEKPEWVISKSQRK